jgi:coenzyme F420-0:L-glutamate ligase / coenzyme F420-1:gamma-L-glutamate ligase
MSMTITALNGIPLVKPGDSVSDLILQALPRNGIELQDDDILVIAQKIVSKSENRLVNLTTVIPSARAVELAQLTQKDARFVELVLQESREVVRTGLNTLIVEHHQGFICANAGVDHSNVDGPWGRPEDWVLLLPLDSDTSAREIRSALEQNAGVRLGVMVIDSHGRPWRIGTVGVSIGLSGLPGLVDMRGQPDLFGFKLRITQVGVADELAAGASLLMGQAAEMKPVVHVRGFPYPLCEGEVKEIIRSKDQDLFR